MDRNEEPIIIPLEADFSAFQSALDDMEKSSRRFAGAFTGSLKTAIRSGASFEDTLKSLALRISDIGLQAGLRPLENAVGNLFQSSVSSLTGAVVGGGATSGFDIGSLLGSVFNATLSGQSTGAVSARTRQPNFLTPSSQQPTQTPNITFNVSSPDVEGFKRSQTQISTLLARSVNRSRRGA